MKKLTLFGISILILMLTSCGGHEETSPRQSGPAVKVKAMEVPVSEVPQSFEFTGSVAGERRINLSTKVMGQITHLPVDEGAKVSRGQTLIKIQSGDVEAKKAQVEANMAEAQAAFKNAETNYNRIKSLHENKSATQKELDDVKTAYDMAKAKIDAIKEMEKEVADLMSYTTITSPINGYVVEKMAQQGDMASPGMPLLTVENLEQLQVITKVPESQIYLFEEGAAVSVAIDALEDQKLTGTVDQINPGGHAASRQFEVKISLDKAGVGKMIKSGMYARVILESGARQIVMVPVDWMIVRGQLEGVFSVNANDEAMLRWVRTGKRFGNDVEILSGLSAGETIVMADAEPLREGQKVEVVQ